MKKFIVVMACMLTLGFVSTAAAEIEVTGDVYATVASDYLWRGFNVNPDDDFVGQTGMDLSISSVTLSWWGNYSEETKTMDEVDYVIDYSKDLTEMVSASVGYIHYQIGGDKVSEAYVGLGLATILEPSVTFYTTMGDSAGDTEGDYFISVGVGHGIEIDEKMAVSIGAALGYSSNEGYDDLHNAELSVGLDYAVNEQVTITPAALVSTPMSDDAEDMAGLEDESAFTVTATLTF